MKEPLLDFVKARLEEDEGVSSDALAEIRGAARKVASDRVCVSGFVSRSRAKRALLLAATLALACCGWLVRERVTARREADLTNVIALLRTADGASPDANVSLEESLLAWQDAPCLD